jgi:hypothetical protein
LFYPALILQPAMDVQPLLAAMHDHPLAAALCVLMGVLGLVFVFSFLLPFDPDFVAINTRAETAEPCEGHGESDLFGAAAYKRTWREMKQARFLVPLGILLCLVSFGIYYGALR